MSEDEEATGLLTDDDDEPTELQDSFDSDDESLQVYHRQTINGVEVSFPYKPYKIQTEYMRNVLLCVEEVITVYLMTIRNKCNIIFLFFRHQMDYLSLQQELVKPFLFFVHPCHGY